MFRHLILILFLSVFSCKSIDNIEEQPKCPIGYECYAEVLKNKSISILKDSIGKIYIEFNEDNSHNVIKYTYKYPGKPNIADDTYIETFYFQVPKEARNISSVDKELMNAKVLVQKSCFCPDAGYELVQKGQLNIKKQKETYYIKFEYDPNRNMQVNLIETEVKI